LRCWREAQRDLIALPGVGMSVMEISHRSKTFEDSCTGRSKTCARSRHPDQLQDPDAQGGASLQFSMVPMNLLGAGATADYIDTGSWADKAIKEAKKVGKVNIAGTQGGQLLPSSSGGRTTLTPAPPTSTSPATTRSKATEWKSLPDPATRRSSSDTSSDMFDGPLDVARHRADLPARRKNLRPSA
jgi:phosphoserine aminotransferase